MTEMTIERADLLAALAKQRNFLRRTVRELGDEQAAERSTVSELCLGGIVKHVALVERGWVEFMVRGPDAMGSMDAAAQEAHAAGFQMRSDETLDGLLSDYEAVAVATGQAVRSIGSLDESHPLPDSPWFERGARWSARTVLLHVIAETAQHCGHADIIREAIDGAKTMG